MSGLDIVLAVVAAAVFVITYALLSWTGAEVSPTPRDWALDLGAAVSTIVIGIAGLVALGEPTSFARPVFAELPNPLVGALAAGATLVSADWSIPRSPRLAGLVHLFTYLAATASMCLHGPASIESTLQAIGAGGATALIKIVTAVAILWGAAIGALLLGSFVQDCVQRSAPAADQGFALPPLLPSQKQFVDDVKARMATPELAGYKLIPVVGRWGDGKSMLLSAIERELRSERTGVVRLNVWQSTSDPHFYQKVVREMYGSPAFTRRWRWLRKPPAIAIEPVRRIRPQRFKLGAFGADAEVAFTSNPPDLPFAKGLARDLRANSQPGRATVVLIVDELDRATPAAAQTALTVLRRAFDEPGVVVLMAYVEDPVHFNAFNPARGLVEDLRSMVLATLAQWRRDDYEDARLDSATPAPSMGQDIADRVRARLAPKAGADSTPPKGSDDSSGDSTRHADPGGFANDALQDLLSAENDLDLLSHYVQWVPRRQAALQRRVAEKFIHGGSMQVPVLKPDDVAKLLIGTDSFRAAVDRGLVDGGDTAKDEVTKAISDAIGVLASQGFLPEERLGAPPPLRPLISTFNRFFVVQAERLAEAQASESGASEPATKLAPKVVAVAAASLYRAAQLSARE